MCKRQEIATRVTSFILRENEVARLKPDAVQLVRDLSEDELKKHTPVYPAKPPISIDASDEIREQVNKQWNAGKAKFDEEQAALPPFKYVTANMPIYDVLEAKIDNMQVRIFHTLRGPIIGMILEHTEWKTTLYSPCFLDPNVTEGKVNCLPIAFAGYRYTLYHRNCMGESLPDEAILLGYPNFIVRNRVGDYKYRSRGAYTDILADMAEDAQFTQTENPVRQALRGLILTSDVRQTAEIEKRKALETAETSAVEEAPAE